MHSWKLLLHCHRCRRYFLIEFIAPFHHFLLLIPRRPTDCSFLLSSRVESSYCHHYSPTPHHTTPSWWWWNIKVHCTLCRARSPKKKWIDSCSSSTKTSILFFFSFSSSSFSLILCCCCCCCWTSSPQLIWNIYQSREEELVDDRSKKEGRRGGLRNPIDVRLTL